MRTKEAETQQISAGRKHSPSHQQEREAGTSKRAMEITLPEKVVEDKVSLLADELLDFLELKFSKDTVFFSRYRESFERRIRDSRHFISLMRELYAGRQFSPLFFEYQDKVPHMTSEGKALAMLLTEIGEHGLSEKEYFVGRIKELARSMETLLSEYEETRENQLQERAARLWKLLEGLDTIPEERAFKALLVRNGFTDDDVPLIRELSKFHLNLLQAKKKLNDAVQELDVLLLRGFFQFLLDFKYVIKAHPFKVTPDLSLAHVTFREQLREDLQKADPHFAGYLRQYIPRNPIYGWLMKGLAKYRKLAMEGALDKLTIKKTMKKGSHGPSVKELAKRLALEGFLAPEQISDRFGSELLEAVKLYQRTHQLRVTGKTDSSTRASMNCSMRTRVRQIELGLQRWRESDIVRDNVPFYIRVNIPQFELEVWDDNKLLRVHRVVVGDNNEEVSIERKQRGRFNQTPLLSAKMTTIVFNPIWFPPPRLQKELLQDLRKEPDFFEKNNYGIKMNDDGTELIFQKPGPANALGLVKFLFPNEYHVYLHDTPKKALFERSIRAYSHGCMRLDKPMELAYFLLDRTNGLSAQDIKTILEKNREKNKGEDKEYYVKLDTPVPIYVEYNTVSADADGWVYFYADIYRYDRAYWENRLPVELAEDLTPSELKKLAGATTDSVLGLDGEDDVDDGVVPGE